MSFNSLSQIAGSINAHARQMQVISENLNHLNTVGAKKTRTEFQEVLSEKAPKVGSPVPAPPHTWYSAPETPRRQEIEKQGLVQQTRRGFDLAISGQGFFITKSRVNDDLGNPPGISLTRNGQVDRLVIREPGGQQTYLTIGQDQDFLMGWRANDNGEINAGENINSLTTLTIEDLARPYGARRSSEMLMQFNLNANTKAGETAKFSRDIIDSQGNAQRFNIEITRNTEVNQWTAKFTAPGHQGFEEERTLEFDSSGILTSDPILEFDLTDQAGNNVPLRVNISDTTSFGAPSSIVYLNDDGRPDGHVTSLEFDKNGDLFAGYSNGATRRVARIPLGDVRAVEQMVPQDGHKWRPTAASGPIEILNVENTERAEVVPSAVELSNIDIADSFAEMIITQRIYSSLTKALTTADEMTKTAVESKL